MRPYAYLARAHGGVAAPIRPSNSRIAISLLVALFVLVTTLVVRSRSTRDPGSWFFNPLVAYTPAYSALRQRQAERFISQANSGEALPFAKRNGGEPASLCLGIPSVARSGTSYLNATVGSLLAGLTQEERDGIHLTLFIPHTDPRVHPAFGEPWMARVADRVLLYNLTKQETRRIARLERQKGLHREKALFDYSYLLKACHTTGAPYIAIVEDDVIALDGWYHRTRQGLHAASRQHTPRRAAGDFLYLRMFYTESYLGWNREDWPTHVAWCLFTLALTTLLIVYLRSRCPPVQRFLTPAAQAVIVGLLVPWALLLLFAAGRVTVFPLPHGINSMNNYGCCAQGLVFPAHKVPGLVEYYTAQRVGFADVLAEQYADERGEQRWALTPSVLQHVGVQSSKTKKQGESGAKAGASEPNVIWNFAFEENRADKLRQEHDLAAFELWD